MSNKRPNYYQVHKNKKIRKAVYFKGLHPKVEECIRLATEVVVKAIRRQQMLISMAQPIPKYKKGISSVPAGIITGKIEPEYFVSQSGKKYKVSEPDNFGRNAKHAGKYEELTAAIKKRMNLTYISSKELTASNEQFVHDMRKISESFSQFLNTKAPN